MDLFDRCSETRRGASGRAASRAGQGLCPSQVQRRPRSRSPPSASPPSASFRTSKSPSERESSKSVTSRDSLCPSLPPSSILRRETNSALKCCAILNFNLRFHVFRTVERTILSSTVDSTAEGHAESSARRRATGRQRQQRSRAVQCRLGAPVVTRSGPALCWQPVASGPNQGHSWQKVLCHVTRAIPDLPLPPRPPTLPIMSYLIFERFQSIFAQPFIPNFIKERRTKNIGPNPQS